MKIQLDRKFNEYVEPQETRIAEVHFGDSGDYVVLQEFHGKLSVMAVSNTLGTLLVRPISGNVIQLEIEDRRSK